MGYPRVRSHEMRFSSFSFATLPSSISFSFAVEFYWSDHAFAPWPFFAEKKLVALCLSLVNVTDLNKVLRSEVFVSEDEQLRAVHLILDFVLLLDAFQDIGNAIEAGNPRLCRIDVSVLGFLAREDLPSVELPLHRALPRAAASREETNSSRLSLEEEIDQFRLEEENEEQGAPVIPISDAEKSSINF